MNSPVQHLGGHKQRVEGALIGGNLTALHGRHTRRPARPGGSILVLEDVGEPYYRLERSLWQLLDARQLGAICLGSFTDCPRKEVAHSLERIFGEYAAAIEVPLTTCPAGMVRRTEPGLQEDRGARGKPVALVEGAPFSVSARREVPLERHKPAGYQARAARQQQPQRQADPRFQAAAIAVAQFDAAAVLGGDALDDRQAEAGALAATRLVATDEGIEDAVHFRGIDALAAIEHAQHHVGAALSPAT